MTDQVLKLKLILEIQEARFLAKQADESYTDEEVRRAEMHLHRAHMRLREALK